MRMRRIREPQTIRILVPRPEIAIRGLCDRKRKTLGWRTHARARREKVTNTPPPPGGGGLLHQSVKSPHPNLSLSDLERAFKIAGFIQNL
jgi:hypothetical protein